MEGQQGRQWGRFALILHVAVVLVLEAVLVVPEGLRLGGGLVNTAQGYAAAVLLVLGFPWSAAIYIEALPAVTVIGVAALVNLLIHTSWWVHAHRPGSLSAFARSRGGLVALLTAACVFGAFGYVYAQRNVLIGDDLERGREYAATVDVPAGLSRAKQLDWLRDHCWDVAADLYGHALGQNGIDSPPRSEKAFYVGCSGFSFGGIEGRIAD